MSASSSYGFVSDTVVYRFDRSEEYNPFRFFDLNRRDNNPHIGTTNFFRHPQFFSWLAGQVNAMDRKTAPRILAAPCCVGAETYSLAAVFEKAGCFARFPKMRISCFDISTEFSRVAKAGRYPHAMHQYIPADYADLFETAPIRLEVPAALRKRVRILNPRDLTKPLNLRPFDIVIASNLLMHLTDDAQKSAMIANLCDVTRSILCINNLMQDARRNVLSLTRHLESHGFHYRNCGTMESLTVFSKTALPHCHA